VLRTKDDGFGLRGVSTPLPFMLAWFSFSVARHSGLSRLVGVEPGVVSSTGVKWCNGV
jgi:hypothetical protein